MLLDIISPDKKIFSGEVEAIVVPGTEGSIGILNHHAPLISTLDAGQVKVTNGQKDEFYDIKGGVVEVLNNKVIILAE